MIDTDCHWVSGSLTSRKTFGLSAGHSDVRISHYSDVLLASDGTEVRNFSNLPFTSKLNRDHLPVLGAYKLKLTSQDFFLRALLTTA